VADPRRIVDLYFTDTGDFVLGENLDFRDTKNDHLRGFLQKAVTRVMSSHGDWRLQPQVGANLQEFLGKQNNRATGEAIRSRVHNELVSSGLLRAGEFIVDVFPVTKSSVAVVIVVHHTRPELTITFTYDFRDNKVSPRNV
jgi:hypothetical protein